MGRVGLSFKGPRMESLFAYTDYRRFLLDFFAEKKRANPRYSLRMLAERSGFKARDYLLRVMKGERNLSRAGAEQLSRFFRFSEKQEEYFQLLVQFNQADTGLEKEDLYRRLSEIQKYGAHQKLRQDQFEYLSAWYHSALRSLLPVLPGGEAWEETARLLDPPLTPKQARDSVELLLRLGLLERDGRGRYSVAHKALSTGDEVASVAVAGFHKATMDLAKRSIERHPAAARDISGVTMSISQSGFRRIKSEIQACRKRIMAIASQDSGEDMVYQLNLHFFPLTRMRGRA
jgi:uncharacterized protein (TIGR02147 family)